MVDKFILDDLGAAYLVARIDDDVRSAQEVSDRAGVGMEQTLPRYRDTISAPVDLHELGQTTLQ